MKSTTTMQKLECRAVIEYRTDGRVNLGMYDPLSGKYERLGTHGPGRAAVDKAVRDLATSITRAGHRLTFCERDVR